VRENERFETDKAFELASVLSKSLDEVVRETNKESLNLQAELLLRTLGKERGALAPLPDLQKMRERSDDEAGLDVVRLWLRERAGVETTNLALHDGSGLSRLNLVTPHATTNLLAQMARTSSSDVFHDSLPVAGLDGTLKVRLRSPRETVGRISAKTGSLTYINSLSGYATSTEGEPLVFSILCNDETDRASSIRVMDAIAAIITAYPTSLNSSR
jgi:D-alanyl-D-alanine carboxypeptidase/D-alanyl-D-alanine-endopeptidase (penicillin-binding protein 4)